MFANILVAFDGSAVSRKALLEAVKISRSQPGGKLEVVHVCTMPRFFSSEALLAISAEVEKLHCDEADAIAEEAKQIVSALPGAQVTLLQGPPAGQILQHAAHTSPDLIVIGSRGLSGIGEFVLGSVSHNVVQHAKVPVLVIK